MKITTFSLLCLFIFIHAGLSKELPFKFGKINKLDFKNEQCSFYPEAKSMIVGEAGNIRFEYSDNRGWIYTMEKTVRKRIFDITDSDQGNIEILLYQPVSGNNKELIHKIKAYSYNLENGKINTEKVNRKDFFETRVNDYWVKLSFAIPNIKKGTIIEYSYQKTSDFLTNLSTWHFQSDIPKAFSQIEVTLPEFFNYQASNVGNVIPLQQESDKKIEKFTYTWEKQSSSNLIGPSKERGTGTMNSLSQTSIYTAVNIPPIIDEPHINNKVDLPSRLQFQLISTQFPNSMMKMIANDYNTFNDQLIKSGSFGLGYLKGVKIREIEINAVSPLDKSIEAFNHISKHFTWNESNSFTSSNAGRTAYKEAIGTVADINLTLLGVFKELDMEAYPVILSTRGHGVPHPVYPSYEDFNYVIIALKIDGKTYFCDASAELPFGEIPIKCRNDKGYLVNENGGKWVDLKTNSNYEKLTSIKIELIENSLTSAIEQRASGYAALNLISKLKNNEESEIINDLKSKYDGAEVLDFSVDQGETISIKYQIKKNTENENIFYIQPITTGSLRESPFKRVERQAPIDFAYAQSYKVYSKIMIPEGYTAELPEPILMHMPNKEATFLYNLSQNGNTIDVVSSIKINKTYFTPAEYEYLKIFYEKAAEKNNEFIVLSKK